MDRSYLSNQAVIGESRQFVCVRLPTYEDQGDADFMTSIYRYRGDVLKNSLFAILGSDGKRHLVEPGRSPKYTFRDGDAMAKRMREIARDHPGKKGASPKSLGVPYLKSVHVALNVAACDAQRLVVVYAPTSADRAKLEALLTPLAWSKELIGGFLYAKASEPKELAAITGTQKSPKPGLLIVEPGNYGVTARQIVHVKLGTSPASAKRTLVKAKLSNSMGSKDSKRHIGRGRRQGVRWDTEIEVADPSQVGGRGRRRR